MSVLILTATAFEQALLRGQLRGGVQGQVAGKPWVAGRLQGRDVRLLQTGLGAVNCAHALTCALQQAVPERVVQVGVGGAYPDSGLQPGDVAVASEENYGDVGVALAAGWRGAEHIGIPLLERAGVSYYNRFPLDAGRAREMAALLSGEWPAAAGPFVTVQECTGTDELGRRRGRHFEALCENMEGAAAAHLCALYEVDFVEVRAISNIAAAREEGKWRLQLACERAQDALVRLLAEEKL